MSLNDSQNTDRLSRGGSPISEDVTVIEESLLNNGPKSDHGVLLLTSLVDSSMLFN
jgi:hypothetical protein